MDKQQLRNLPEILNIYKNRGDTPIQTLEKLREKHPEYKDEVLSYAGRLDPMAEGVLLVLVGKEANKKENREKYLGLDKEYEVEILFGFETDTGDVLGKVINHDELKGGDRIVEESKEYFYQKFKENLEKELKKSIGTFEQVYPAYSSKPVQGKPLFKWARKGKLDEIEIPKKSVTIFDALMLETKKITSKGLLGAIEHDIAAISGDFRQEEILKIWRNALKKEKKNEKSYAIAKVKIMCSSGAYMRLLAHNLGKSLKGSACAYTIKRLKIGIFTIHTSIKI